MYNNLGLEPIVDISSVRKELSKLVDSVYFNNKSFIIAKRNIPVAKVVKFYPAKEKVLPGKKKLNLSLFGLLKNERKTAAALAADYRKTSWARK
ncbi:hypothetical protein KKB83_01570 [Patescibacteria group bacterium]|nr:hypothetical protein [Patescibacteria group bacterium]